MNVREYASFSNVVDTFDGFDITPRGSHDPTFHDDTTGIDSKRIEDILGWFDSRLVEITFLIGAITTILTSVDIMMYRGNKISLRTNYSLVVLILSCVTLLCILMSWYRKIILANIGGLVFLVTCCLLLIWVNYAIYAHRNFF